MAVFDARLPSTLLIPIVFISSYFLFMALLIFIHAYYYSPVTAAFLFDTGSFPVSYQLYLWALHLFRVGFSFLHPFVLRSAAWVFDSLR